MTVVEYEPDVNTEELRTRLADRLTLLVMCGTGFLTWLSLLRLPSPVAILGLLAGMASGWGLRRLIKARPTLARHLLVWSSSLAVLAGMWFSLELWIPFLGLMPVWVGAMLVPGSEFATTGVIAAVAVWLVRNGYRAYPLPEQLAVLALGVALTRLVTSTLYTALEWAWTAQQRADHLLELARDRQGELSRAFKSLDTSNALLRRTQRELIVARRQAEEARLIKEQFAANVSHELRTPLNLILGFSEIMSLSPEVYGDVKWPPTLRQDINQIHRSSRHLLEMIDDVLDLSRLEMVGFTLDKEPTPLGPLLRETEDITRDLFRGQPVRLEFEIEDDLPALEIDRTRIRQVLLNLLNNAARFTEQGLVKVEARQRDGEVLTSVSDTGPGIPADKLPHLFEEFYQVDCSLSRKFRGAGLGLPISKHFVEAHNGRIWVESDEGVGSTFTFALPIPDGQVPFSRLHKSRPLELMQSDLLYPILVVDPDPAVADLIRRHVEGYDVLQVETAGRLAEEVMLHHPHAVVYNMPPGERREHDDVLSTDIVISASVPVIGCSLPSQAWVANDLSVEAYLSKPVTAERLLQEINRQGDIQDVLIVDDDRGFCRLVERMLATDERGFDVRRAYSGESGLQALRTKRPDLLLLDLIMPGVDGFQILEEIQGEPDLADVPIVLLTAASFAEDALAQRRGQMVIQRSGGLWPHEALGCLRAILEVLEPHYDERSTPDSE